MQKATMAWASVAAIVGATLLALGDQPTAPADITAPGAPPVHRLDASFHRMAPDLVAKLLAHPPEDGPFERRRFCKQTAENGYERLGYCVCFGASCRKGPEIEMGDDLWGCTGPFGFVSGTTAVCAARVIATKVIIG